MDSQGSMRAHADFSAARAKALFRGVLAAITGHRNDLLAWETVREKLRLGGPIYRGVQPVLVEKIVGSVNRYRDFDRAFLPTQVHTADRWRRISRAWYEDVSLPPVLLYKVGEAYFVIDGNHRVSVAREQGQIFIDAEVREITSKVAVGPDLQPEDLEILGAKVEFLERTNLDRLRPAADVTTTILGGYDRLLEHIAVHRYFMGLDFERDVPAEEAVEHWYDAVYLPVVQVVRDSGIMAALPGRTEADFYLWALDHRHYLMEPVQAAEDFVQRFRDDEPGAASLPGARGRDE